MLLAYICRPYHKWSSRSRRITKTQKTNKNLCDNQTKIDGDDLTYPVSAQSVLKCLICSLSVSLPVFRLLGWSALKLAGVEFFIQSVNAFTDRSFWCVCVVCVANESFITGEFLIMSAVEQSPHTLRLSKIMVKANSTQIITILRMELWTASLRGFPFNFFFFESPRLPVCLFLSTEQTLYTELNNHVDSQFSVENQYLIHTHAQIMIVTVYVR